MLHHRWRPDTEDLMELDVSSVADTKPKHVAELFDLKGRVAIITGGAGLLGYYHGAILNAAGAYVVLLDLPVANPQLRARQLATEYGSEALGIATDITSEVS